MKKIKWFCSIGLCSIFLFFANFAQGENAPLAQEEVERFSRALAEVKEFYVHPLTDQVILENAMKGMLEGLDPHSNYLNEEEYKALMESTEGSFAGLGIELTVEFGLIKVVTPLDDGPAYHAGIKPGDYIAEINGKPVGDMKLDKAVALMRGAKSTDVSLTILRKNQMEPLKFTLTRDIINVASVKNKLFDEHYGYIRIIQFQEKTADDVIAALITLQKESKENLKGLVLDLRNNPGGLLDSAVKVSDTFIDGTLKNAFDNKIVFTKGRVPGADMTAYATSGDKISGAPMVVLINEGSASAAEIVAGALQDYHRAIIVGKTSFGKGSVQTVLPLDKTHAIKLTTALYYTPAGREIQDKGIVPDIMVDALKMANDNPAAVALTPLKETDLRAHLVGANEKPQDIAPQDVVDKQIAKSDKTPELAREDYQLYEALNILKTMQIAQRVEILTVSDTHAQ